MYKHTQFGELMKGLPRGTFEKIVNKNRSDKHSKGFRCWDQLLAMIYGQVSGSQSLRELETGFNSQSAHHYHLGTKDVRRSTLADANANRNCKVFEETCKHLLQQVHSKLKDDVEDLLYLIDSSGIRLAGFGYDDWTKDNKSHRIQGIKMHTVYSPQADVPIHVDLSPGNIQDVEMGKKVRIEKGATYAFDKGYYDYNWWYAIETSGAKFVTRFKKNAQLKTISTHEVPPEFEESIIEDSTVEFAQKVRDKRRENKYLGTALRKVVVYREDKDSPLVLATNDFERSAQEIADIYKKRWAIELFFKWIKQNLKLKKYLGRSENAVKTQIYIALITYLLVKICHQGSGSVLTLKLWLVELKSTLFSRPEIAGDVERRRRTEQIELNKRQMRMAL